MTTERDVPKVTEGWATLAAENEVVVGDYLEFIYYGNSSFRFSVLGRDHAVNRLPAIANHVAPAQPPRGRGRPPKIDENCECTFAARAFLEHSTWPNFIVKLNQGYMTNGNVSIPTEFSREWLFYEGKQFLPTTITNQGKNWSTEIKMYMSDSTLKSTKLVGLKPFFSSRGVRVSAVLAFEMTEVYPVELKITIFN